MADKKKTSDKQAPSRDEIEDAVILNTPEDAATPQMGIAPEDTAPTDLEAAVTEPQRASGETPENAASDHPEPVPEETVQDNPQAGDIPSAEASSEAAVHTSEVAPKSTETVIVRKGGFVPMLLGGVAAAAIGFGLARSGVLEGLPLPGLGAAQDQMADLSQRLETQGATISDLSGRLSALESAPEPALPEVADPTPLIEDLSVQIGVLAQRIDALEARPATGSGAADPSTQAALELAQAELDQIRQAIDAQRGEIAALTDAAAQEEEAAALTARGAMQRAALSRIQTALDTGTPYAEAVTDLRDSGLEVPQPLIQQADSGVATLPVLQAGFPDLARDALRAARQENGGTGLSGFLESQLGLRSLEPREGGDPDAVLSRAEASLRTGALAEALVELDALPESAATILADWRAQAETRLAAIAAAQDLAQALNTN